jgi:hypothetical protein
MLRGFIPHSLALVPLHSDDFCNFELLWVIFYFLIKFTKKVVLGIILGETS